MDSGKPFWEQPVPLPAGDGGGPLKFLSGSDFVNGFTPPDALVYGYFPRGRLMTLTGPTGAGKTNVALYLAACVAQGMRFASSPFPADTGNVLFLAGENPDDVKARAIGLFDEWGFSPEACDRITFVEKPFSIEEHIEEIRSCATGKRAFDLIVVDTLMAFFPGDDDNSNAEMKAFAQELRLLLDIPGNPLVLVPAHPTKSATKEDLQPRGGGAFLAEIDGNYCLWPSSDKTTELYPHPFKFRGTPFPPLKLQIKVRSDVPGTKDSKGRSITIPLAVPVTAKEVAQKIEMDIDEMDKILLPLEGEKYVKRKDLLEASGLAKSTAERRLKSLEDAKYVENTRRGQYTLTSKGKKWIEAYHKAAGVVNLGDEMGGESGGEI